MKSLSPDLRGRLTKLLPRLASPFEGERVATVAAIERVLQAEGCDFHDLTQAVQQPPRITATAAPAKRDDGGLEHNKLRSIIDSIEGADAQRCFLNARSRTFLTDLRGRCQRYHFVFLSERQSAWLRSLEQSGKV
jgi:hypothetical protein